MTYLPDGSGEPMAPETSDGLVAAAGEAGLVALLTRLAAGEEAVWSQVVAEHGHLVVTAIRSVLKDRDLVEDAVQETWLRLRAQAARFVQERCRDEAAAQAWLRTLAARTALNLVRHWTRARQRDRRAGEPVQAPEVPEASLLRQEQ